MTKIKPFIFFLSIRTRRAAFSLLIMLAFLHGTQAQDKLTTEEEKAVVEMRHLFNDSLDANGSLAPLIPKLFASDFVARCIKERKLSDKDSSRILLGPGLEYDSKLFSGATEDDWKRGLIATFDILRPGETAIMNLMAASIRNKKEPDADELETLVMRVYPASVRQLFAKDEILKNFLQQRGSGVTIRTTAELRRVTDTLEKAVVLMKKDGDPRNNVLTSDARNARDMFLAKPDHTFGPWLSIADRETYGFPVGTRIIDFFVTPMTQVTMVKIGTEYKLILAVPSSPD